jgi:SAM-dependent methyltransferase
MPKIDFIAYPPTSFPFRDLLVLEQLRLERDRRICEIGVGSGETTARLARLCGKITGFDISRPALEALQYLEQRHPNLRLVPADITDAAAVEGHRAHFDCAFSCDTLEHVADPAGFFRGIFALLTPGGELAVTFPNEPRNMMHGITRFDSSEELRALACAAGFQDVRIGAARLTPHADAVARRFGWKPLALARELVAMSRSLARKLRRAASPAKDWELPPQDWELPPQVFDETAFFRNRSLWRRLSPAVNLYWTWVLRRMAARGPSFGIDWGFRFTAFTRCQVFLAARKPAGLAAVA